MCDDWISAKTLELFDQIYAASTLELYLDCSNRRCLWHQIDICKNANFNTVGNHKK